MAKIISFEPPSEKDLAQSPIKSLKDWFTSLDKFTKMFFLTILALILVTPFFAYQQQLLHTNAAEPDSSGSAQTIIPITPTTIPSITSIPTPTCSPRPACLDATPRCAILEPVGGFCAPTITPIIKTTPTPTPPTPTPTSNILSQGDGLFGIYFNNLNFSGIPLYRVDPNINFDWGINSPMRGISTSNFSVRWIGFVIPDRSEIYTFYGNSDDGIKIWVNNQLVVNGWYDHSAKEFLGNIKLLANQKYAIKVEFYDHFGNASVKLSWSSPSTPKQIIPKSQLYTFN